jgi:hypothetical protein
MKNIPLANGLEALYHSSRMTRVKDVNPDEDIPVYLYDIPCPVCMFENKAHSYDQIVFINFQITCRQCGVFYRPMVEPSYVQEEMKKKE